MKPVRSLALALALSGLGATSVVAQYGESLRYPSTGRYSAPTLLPLPEASGPWVPAATAAERSTAADCVSPAANYAPQPPSPTIMTTSARTPVARPTTPTVANPYYPQLNYTAVQEVVPPPAPTPGGPPVIVESGPNTFVPNVYDQAAANACWGGDCGCEIDTCCTNWYGYVGGLVMGRDRPNRFWTTFETGNNANQLAYFPDPGWGGGFETTIGYSWCGTGDGCGMHGGCAGECAGACGSPYRHGVEVTYWGLWGLDSEDTIRSDANLLSTPIDLGFVDVPTAGLPASVFFDNAREHRLRRENEFHNVEVNLVDFSTPMSGRDLEFRWLAGARFFKFDEFLQFGSVSSGNEFGSGGGLNEAYLDLDVENNLIGAQIGGRGDWRVGRSWKIFASTKVGVFANDINFDTQLSRGDGALGTFASTGNTFDLSAHKTDVSMLAQIDLGVGWNFSRHWSANIGYRAVGITGLALADDQIPAFLAAEGDWTDIDSNGSMILHGGFAGLEFRY